MIARFLGRGLIKPILGGHINFCRRCSDKLLTKVVLLSRLFPFVSFDIISYGAGLTKMSLGKFILATVIGMAPPTFIYTYFGSIIIVSPSFSVPAAVGLVVLFFLIPRWIEKLDLVGFSRHSRHEK